MRRKRQRLRKDVLIQLWWQECQTRGAQLFNLELDRRRAARDTGHLDRAEYGWHSRIAADLLFEAWSKWADGVVPFYSRSVEKRGFMIMFCRIAGDAIADKKTRSCSGKRTQVVYFAPFHTHHQPRQGEAI